MRYREARRLQSSGLVAEKSTAVERHGLNRGLVLVGEALVNLMPAGQSLYFWYSLQVLYPNRIAMMFGQAWIVDWLQHPVLEHCLEDANVVLSLLACHRRS